MLVLIPGSTSLSQLETIWRTEVSVALAPAARLMIDRAAQIVAAAAIGEEAIYGVNTGFGKLASIKINFEDMQTLQRNLVLSHCCGVGEMLDVPTARLMIVLKLLSLGRGASGVSWQTIEMLE